MNCQQVQSLFEDAIDRRLAGRTKRNFDLHLSRCPACRARLVAEQREHTRWFHAFNDGGVAHHVLSADFADRLAASAAVLSPRPRLFSRLPRWVRIAASLAAAATLAAFGSWAVVSAGDDFQQSTRIQEAKPMKVKLAAAAVAVGAATLQSSFANSCIISGSTERTSASTAWDESGNLELDSRVQTSETDAPLEQFESRFALSCFGAPFEKFRSDEPRGYVIIIR